ncbi:carboxypeptidase-like regulatory domain-containing protein [Roseiconus sp. JC912]
MRSFRSTVLCFASLFPMTAAIQNADAQDAGTLVTQQWSSVSSSGKLRAAILPPFGGQYQQGSPVQVNIIGQDGNVVLGASDEASETDLLFESIQPGTYTLVATGPELVAIYAMHVVEDAEATSGLPMLVAPAALPIEVVRKAASRYLPMEVNFASVFTPTSGTKMLQTQTDSPNSLVKLAANQVSGQLFRAGADRQGLIKAGVNNVLVYQGNALVAQVVSEETGAFRVDGLTPGPYSIIIAGPDGLAVTGFEVVEAGTSTASLGIADDQHLVSMKAAVNHSVFAVQLAPVGLNSPALDKLFDDSVPGPANVAASGPPVAGVPAAQVPGGGAGGSFGGGGGGGGGGLGGGGGIGPIVGLSVVGAAIAIAASDDDDTLVPPPIASPSTP